MKQKHYIFSKEVIEKAQAIQKELKAKKVNAPHGFWREFFKRSGIEYSNRIATCLLYHGKKKQEAKKIESELLDKYFGKNTQKEGFSK